MGDYHQIKWRSRIGNLVHRNWKAVAAVVRTYTCPHVRGACFRGAAINNHRGLVNLFLCIGALNLLFSLLVVYVEGVPDARVAHEYCNPFVDAGHFDSCSGY